MRLFASGLRKLVRRPATWVTLGLFIGLQTLIILAIGVTANGRAANAAGTARNAAEHAFLTFPGAYDQILAFMLGFGGLLALLYGAAIAGSEWSWGTLKAAVARGESRSRYMLVSYASIALLTGIGLLVTFAAGVLAVVVGANIAGISTSGMSDSATLGRLPEQALRGWFGIVMEGALGFTIATLARSQLAGIGIGLAFYFGEAFSSIFLPDIVKYLPFAVARAAVAVGNTGGAFGGGGGGGAGEAVLPDNQALVLVGVWLVVALLVTAIFTERAEITG